MPSKSRGGSRPARKTAMVQPIASRPEELPLFASPELEAKLIKTLQLMGNDRAYDVLEYHATWAWVHFEGDAEGKTITYKIK